MGVYERHAAGEVLVLCLFVVAMGKQRPDVALYARRELYRVQSRKAVGG